MQNTSVHLPLLPPLLPPQARGKSWNLDSLNSRTRSEKFYFQRGVCPIRQKVVPSVSISISKCKIWFFFVCSAFIFKFYIFLFKLDETVTLHSILLGYFSLKIFPFLFLENRNEHTFIQQVHT